jgi:hypothetical protein
MANLFGGMATFDASFNLDDGEDVSFVSVLGTDSAATPRDGTSFNSDASGSSLESSVGLHPVDENAADSLENPDPAVEEMEKKFTSDLQSGELMVRLCCTLVNRNPLITKLESQNVIILE